jgi:Ca2+-binding EF-hand superfamily protein
MDADNDGWVEPGEIHAWRYRVIDVDNDGIITVVEHRAYWAGWKGVVNTDLEKKYDANGDGYLDWVEAQALLRDRLRIIETDGRAIVNTDLEREFDADGDGVIDREEAEGIRDVLD